MNMKDQINFIKENKNFLVVIAFLLLLGVLMIIFQPVGTSIMPASATATATPSLTATILLIFTGTGLLYRWNSGGRKNTVTLVWGASSLLFSITFIGMLLKNFGVAWADYNNPVIFFAFRNVMILWVAGMFYGISKILFKSEMNRVAITLFILVFNYSWFGYTLLMLGKIEMAMYGFLYLAFIPVCATIIYCFYKYGMTTGFSSLKIIALGFAIIAVSYMAWAPWHTTNTYLLWFSVFNIGLAVKLTGFVALAYEKRIPTKRLLKTQD
jgi:hypothetical protein